LADLGETRPRACYGAAQAEPSDAISKNRVWFCVGSHCKLLKERAIFRQTAHALTDHALEPVSGIFGL
jgi:hypothetical protein